MNCSSHDLIKLIQDCPADLPKLIGERDRTDFGRDIDLTAIVVDAGKQKFNETYKNWITNYNADIEKNGLWCDGQAAWKEAKL